MPFRTRFISCLIVLLALVGFACAPALRAQDDDSKPERHGRKYKAPPETSQVHVTVVKGFNKKPIDGAHVIMHPMINGGVDEGGLEFKTHQDGSISTDVIPTGSTVMIQVLADGFATYAKDYVIDQPNQEITIAMQRPKAQVSTYVDNADKPSQRQPGVQEPVRPKKPATPGASSSSSSSTNNSSGTKPQN